MRSFALALLIMCSLCLGAGEAQVCTGLCLQQVSCANGGTTSISGAVYAPNGVDPLPNVLVYVPSTAVGPLPSGLSCPAPGEQPSGVPLVGATTAADGTFRIANVPVGTAIPLVVKIGKWRRQVVVPATTACADTAFSTRLPRNQSEGDLPRIAIVTSSTDQMECVLRAAGVDDAEVTNPGGSSPGMQGRINLFTGRSFPGAQVDGATPDELTLMKNQAVLNAYDVLMLPSQGNYVAPVVDAGQQATLAGFVNAGGRAYLSHFEWTYLDENGLIGLDRPTQGMWWVDNVPPGVEAPYLATPSATVNPFLPEAEVMADWMQATHVTTTRGVIPFGGETQNDIVYSGVQTWFSNTAQAPYGDALQIVGQTPVTAGSAANACGRVVFNDYEIRPTKHVGYVASPTFPAECTAGFLSPEEKAFEYALFELTPDASANLSPLGFDFGTLPIGVASAPHTFTWTNNSEFAATATATTVGSDFRVVSTTCGVVPGNGSCQVDVVFQPTGLRLRQGNVVVTSTGLLGTEQAFVQGTGTQDLSFDTNYLQFGTHPVGSVTTLPLTVTNVAPFAAPLLPLVARGDFSASTGTCGTAVPANGSCTLQVSFEPTEAGERVGTLTPPGTEPVNLEGMGGDYSVTAVPMSGGTEAGMSETFALMVAPVGAFAGSVNLLCTTDAPVTTCALPGSVSLAQGSVSAAVIVRTTSKYTVPGYGYGELERGLRNGSQQRGMWPALAACVPVLWLVRRRSGGLRGRLLVVVLWPALVAGLSIGLVGCSGKYPALNPAYTPAGRYTVTVTANSNGLRHTASYALTVTQ